MSMAATAWVTWLCACARYRVGVPVILDPRALVFYHVTDGDKRKREELWGREWCSSESLAFIYFCFVFVFLFLFCQKEQRYYRSEKIAQSYSFVGSYISPQIIVTQ